MMDNLGAIGGPLFALALVGLIGVRSRCCSRHPRPACHARDRLRHPRHPTPTVRAHSRSACTSAHCSTATLDGYSRHRRIRVGNVAATLLILRATELLQPGRSHTSAAELALVLYAAYNLAATLASIPAGHAGDRHGQLRILGGGAACFLIAYLGFAFTGESFAVLAGCFILAGIGIGAAETSETAAVAGLAPEQLRGSAFGLLAALQAAGNLAASTIAGLLWTAISPTASFIYVAAWMLLALAGVLMTALPERGKVP